MPSSSENQHRAMEAAAHGNSTLGIPKKVGEEFVAKDATAGIAAGVMFVAPDGSILFVRRAQDEANYAGYWALPGGKADGDETPEAAADREAMEEIGFPVGKKKVIDQRITPNGMAFHTFASAVNDKIAPTLNGEHDGFIWAPLDKLPSPLHPAVKATLTDRLLSAQDMSPEDWTGLRTGFAKWTREEEAEPEHADDGVVQLPSEMKIIRQKTGRSAHAQDELLAMDRSVRSYDPDGRLRVAKAHISKANICPYFGREIPDAEALRLDPEKRYQLLRHPDELKKAAETSNGVPLLIKHVPVNADDHQPDLVVGSIGTDAEFDGEYLNNSLIIWAREGIDGVETEVQKELSSAYRYRADMTPGEFEGTPYDGVMRDISFNHVALVPEGRAGADVVVGDSQIKERNVFMSKKVLTRFAAMAGGSVFAYLQPKMAADAKIDLAPMLEGITAKNFKSKKAKLAADIKAKVVLAKDANIDDVMGLLDKLEDCPVLEGADEDPNSGLPMSKEDMDKKAKDEAEAAVKAKDAEPAGKAKEFLKGKLSAEDMKAFDDIMGEVDGMDAEETDEEKAAKAAKDAEPKPVDAKAMDAAIKKATTDTAAQVRREMNEIAEAREFVAPWVGKIGLAMDSAADVYKAALGVLKVKTEGVHPSAFRSILEAQPQPGARKTIALDASVHDESGFNSRWGGTAGRIEAA